MSELRATEYAILIGIDAYKDRPLKGCVNDVLGIQKILEQQSHATISVFTATSQARVSTDNDFQLMEGGNQLPTHGNVTSAVRRIREQAREGDSVYIHYSGHGTCDPPNPAEVDDNKSNRYTGNLALVLLDENDPARVKCWPGPLFAASINGLVAKGLIVTVVLDCCFSAAVYRNSDDTDIRYFPYNAKASWATGTEDDEIQAVRSAMRRVSMSPSWLIDPQGYSLLAGCGPTEIALEVKVRGQVFGKLSHFLCELLRSHGVRRRQTNIYSHLRAMFWERPGRLPQTPVLYGKKEQFFLGNPPLSRDRTSVYGPNEESGDEVAIIPIALEEGGQVRMLAGEAHGFSDGDDVVLYPDSMSDPAMHPLRANIRKVYSVTSVLDIGDDTEGDNISSVNWVAKPLVRRTLSNFVISLDHSLVDLELWRATFAQRSLVEYDAAQHRKPHFYVRVREDSSRSASMYEILSASGRQLTNMPPMPTSHTEIDDVAAVLSHLAKYEMALGLMNNKLRSNDSFRASFEVYATTRSGVKHLPGQTMHLQERRGRGHTFEIHVRIEDWAKQDLFVYIYSLGPQWEVEHVHKGTLDVVPRPQSIKEQHGRAFSPTYSRKLRTWVPEALKKEGCRESNDVIKVFVTARSTAFDLLELPVVGLPHKKGSERGASEQQSKPVTKDGAEQWASFNFPIRTTWQEEHEA